ncbi:class I SAM-dependent methyltransferase [Pararhodospirillum oryzae]|uniref:Methyltransferase n=1 Tax=Pararhodospirillum oryzae TaxID=478448 RepID=A0A512H7V4_9PROT|nr:class I SAM-dependent methyltransferase [Pararhodospirillum oryzae]GEO81537.1 methyltransferase [Pararhodospirillum oryzae]
MKNYTTNVFWGPKNHGDFIKGLQQCCDTLDPMGIFIGDNMFTFKRNLSFLDDGPFMASVNTNAGEEKEKAIIWRTAVLLWAARNGLRRKGDFVECGTYKGTSARILCDALDFAHCDRSFHLYDAFDLPPEMEYLRGPSHGPDLYPAVVKRFAHFPNVHIHKGIIPDIFVREGVPDVISFLHIDMNNAHAELSALEFLFDRVVDGGMIILDDYGWINNKDQKIAEDNFFIKKGLHVLEIPTGQGLCLK